MKKFIEILMWVVGSINSIASIIILFIVCPRIINNRELGFDYMGFIIAILAILVTLLITWNIYSALNIKRDMENTQKDFEQIKETLSKKVETIENEFVSKTKEFNNSLDNKTKEIINIVKKADESAGKRFLYNRAEMETELAMSIYSDVDRFGYAIEHLLSAIGLWSELKEFQKASIGVSHILNTIPSNAEVRQRDKERWLIRLKKMPNQESIKRIEELYVFLSNLKIRAVK